jgi:lipopolysaccharide assembly outer membrane protein LptD (OstA)
MRNFPAIAALIFFAALSPVISKAQEDSALDMRALSQVIPGLPEGHMEYNLTTGLAVWTNGVFIKNGDTVLTADTATVNQETSVAVADGHVHIEQGDQLWVGDHVTYNFKTHQMQSEQFRTGDPPMFAAGKELEGDTSNKTYTAHHDFVTTDDVSDPAIRIRASSIRIVPGKYVEMWNAVVFLKGVPVFYYPYYKRNLGNRADNLNLMPGYRSSYGPYLLTTYTWYLGDNMDGKFHLDYREQRGLGVGPDVNMQLGRWGDVSFKYYYLHDQEPESGTNGVPNVSYVPQNRQRVYFSWQATPATNLNVKALVNYQTDPFVLHDYFEGAYRDNPQPNTFTEVNKYWNNWSLDAETTPRINSFFDQIERLPDVKLTGFRQKVFNTPVYYESESSAGYYRQFMVNTNGTFPNPIGAYGDSAARADTFHQLLLPWTFFNWLNITPHVGGRFTYYSEENPLTAGTNDETYRTVFDTGIGASFKASQLWAGAKNSFLEIDGLRHIIEPSVNYIFVPNPSTPPSQLPQFDAALPSLLLLPVGFPDYNDIDSVDSENVIRFGLRNTLQTMREGQLDNLFDWNLTLDWRLKPDPNQANLDEPFSATQTFSDLYSDLTLKPRSWITFESQLRYDINGGNLNLAFHQLTFTPNEKWSWGLGHWYLRGNFDGFTEGDNLFTSTIFYRLNDNWGFRATHYFNAGDGRLQEQFYSIYRDWRSWTGALTFRVTDNETGPEDFTIAFSFSLKASPAHHLGDDAVKPYQLVGE